MGIYSNVNHVDKIPGVKNSNKSYKRFLVQQSYLVGSDILKTFLSARLLHWDMILGSKKMFIVWTFGLL